MKNKDLYIKRLIAQGMLYDEAVEFVDLIANDVLVSNNLGFYIRVDYQTGDSFNTYNTHEDINLPWYNIDIVKENAKRLSEQVKLYSDIDYYSAPEIIKSSKEAWANAPWAVFYEPNTAWSSSGIRLDDGRIINQYAIKLLKDDGTEFQISTSSWMGYFEHFQEFTINEITRLNSRYND